MAHVFFSRRQQSHRRDRRGAAGGQQDEAQRVHQVLHQPASTEGPQPHQPGVLRLKVSRSLCWLRSS